MIADIFTGETDAADFLFLIAAVLAAVVAFMRWPEQQITGTLGWLAVGAIAFGLLLQ